MASTLKLPGLALEHFTTPPDLAFRTGVSGFLGPAVAADPAQLPTKPAPLSFTSWRDFANSFTGRGRWRPAQAHPDEITWNAVQGFFINGGVRCWVVLYDSSATGDPLVALDLAVTALAELDDVDLVCAPSLVAADRPLELQRQLLASCQRRQLEAQRHDWFLILDPPRREAGIELSRWVGGLCAGFDRPEDAALYHPWVALGGDYEPAPDAKLGRVPPSGHIAGVFARTDHMVGVHKAPANEPIHGIVDVEDVADVAYANPLRAFPGRGIRVWGARTLAAPQSTLDASAFVGARRLMLTLNRWLVRALDWVVFEPNDFRLWVRVNRELNAHLAELFRLGALQGRNTDEAFYVKCDAENNPPTSQAGGQLQVDIGVAPAVPSEFIQIRVVRNAQGLTVS